MNSEGEKLDQELLHRMKEFIEQTPVGYFSFVEKGLLQVDRLDGKKVRITSHIIALPEHIAKLVLANTGYESVEALIEKHRQYAMAAGYVVIHFRSLPSHQIHS